MVPPPIPKFYQGNQAQRACQGNHSSHSSSKSSVQPEPKKRKVAETALASRSKAASASGSSQPVKVGKPYPSTQAVQKQTAKRIESFARFNQKAQLYQAAMERFHQSLVYYNRRFCENIEEADLVDLTGKSEEVKMTVAQKRKLKNCTASTRVLKAHRRARGNSGSGCG